MKYRCAWAENTRKNHAHNELMKAYHDSEWGVPQHNDHILFEYLILDSAQAGLSWSTILNKRENYRTALDNFNPQKIAHYSNTKRAELLQNPGIIRNKLKIESHIQNAQAFLHIQKEFGSFDTYIWEFVKGKPIVNSWRSLSEIPAETPLSVEISKDLKTRGMNFVGPTIIYAFMQAAGLVNDHEIQCFRYSSCIEQGNR